MYELPEVSELEQLLSDYSDLYKDVWGCRPRFEGMRQWTLEVASAEMDSLIKRSEVVFAEEEAEQLRSIVAFENHVRDLIEKFGAKDRATALRWIDQEYNCNGDREFLCYCANLPYRYFNEEKAA